MKKRKNFSVPAEAIPSESRIARSASSSVKVYDSARRLSMSTRK